MIDFTNTRFIGEATKVLAPTALAIIHHPLSIGMTRIGAQQIIKSFLISRRSIHSGINATGWVIEEYCKAKNINYDIQKVKALGLAYFRIEYDEI